MASTDPAAGRIETLHPLQTDNAAMLDALVVASGWNQTPDDWQAFAQLGSIFGLRGTGARIVASGAVLPLEPRAAWISMILVAPELRGRGLGRMVFEHCLHAVRAADRVAMLDATPAGEKLYAQFGFSPLWRSSRWQRACASASDQRRSRSLPGLDVLAAADTAATGLQRHRLLAQIGTRPGAQALRLDQACCLLRSGRIAQHIGPLLAPDGSSAAALLSDIADSTASALLLDVPHDRPLMQCALEASGFARVRSFTRMALGAPVPDGRHDFIHAIAGPEYG